MAIGMAIFGFPPGVTLVAAIDNRAFLGVFIGAGLSIGLAIGLSLDKKAEKEGKTLDIPSPD